ncbi:MAG: hypothetical protein ABIJ86_17970 [Spirochaetota bacterium]
MMEIQFTRFKLGLSSRFTIAACCYAASILVQVQFGFLPGLVFILAGWLFLGIKPTTNKPKDQGLEEWRAVSDTEITRIVDNLKASKKIRAVIIGRKALRILGAFGLVFIVFLLAPISLVVSMAAFNFALFSVPAFYFGKVSIFIPSDLDLKIPGFMTLLNASRPAGQVLTPYLRFDKDEEGRDVPEDIRFMLEPKRKPDDLVGIQFQSSINNGANGKVPYMYAVVLCRGKTGLTYEYFSRLSTRIFIVEAGGDSEYGTIVVRQKTGGTGYHTKNGDCQRLFEQMAGALAKAVPKGNDLKLNSG